MPTLTQISVTQLSRLIGTAAMPVVVDVCIDEDFAADPRIIPGSIKHPFNTVHLLAPALEGQRVVIVCQKGLKLSEGAAAVLRSHGVLAEHLRGGIVAWREAGEMLVPYASIPQPGTDGSTWWVTRTRPKIDRIACPWLIRRFIDRQARFMFVSGSQVQLVAEKYNAIPFDVDGVDFSHRGELCTFDAMLKHFNLKNESLTELAKIVRAADTNQHQLAAEAAGLLAVSLGLSRLYKDDLQQLDAGMMVYDALYRWVRDAKDESHNSSLHISAEGQSIE